MSTQRAEIIAEIERRRFELNLGLLRIYNYYRTFIGLSLLAAYSQDLFATPLGSLEPTLFWLGGLAYTAVNLVSAVLSHLVPRRWFNRQVLSLGLLSFDIVSLVFLTYCSAGIGSGLGGLILITVATGAIIVTGRMATLIAALATIALLYEEFYIALSGASATYDFFQAGIFGALYFIASLSIQRLSNRVRQNDIRALTQAAELADLERLNKQIIQRMRTGILVVDQNDEIRMCNQSARALLGAHGSEELAELPVKLADVLNLWRTDMSHRVSPFQVDPQAPVVRVNFSAVRHADPDGDVTIFLEDTGEVQQQAQQLKLAELGRLSASIAHEVRNPLGAISHAAQLLNESDDLKVADQRLTDIIISHCKRMDGVVENVLDMSRRSAPEPAMVNLFELLGEFTQKFTDAVPNADISYSVDPPDTQVRVDPVQLGQALTNLVDNAIRHSAENEQGHSVLLEGGIDSSTDRPYLNVIDYGVGVADEIKANLFQPFETTSLKGTGLGLYISRELCEANQAQLSYFRHHGGGSCFRILFAHPDRITG